jgi:hypothetical protein
MLERKKRLVSRGRFLEMFAGLGGAALLALLTGCGGLFTQEPTSPPTAVRELSPLPDPTMIPTTEAPPTATATVTATATEAPATPTETATPSPTEVVVPTEMPAEIVDDLPAWSQPRLSQDENGNYVIMDSNDRVIAEWNGAEWVNKMSVFYACGPDQFPRIRGLPSGVVEELELSTREYSFEQGSITGCLIDVAHPAEDDEFQSGLVLTVRVWESQQVYKDYKMVYGYTSKNDGLDYFPIMEFREATILRERDAVEEILLERLYDPRNHNQVRLYIVSADFTPDGMSERSDQINASSEKARQLFRALKGEDEFPEYDDEEIIFVIRLDLY